MINPTIQELERQKQLLEDILRLYKDIARQSALICPQPNFIPQPMVWPVWPTYNGPYITYCCNDTSLNN